MDERKRPMPLTKFLDPKNDVAFKKIFGTEKNKDILIHFLNDMLVFKEQKPIVDVSFLKTVQDPDISSKKTSVVDVLCTDQDKNTYVVEMQVASHSGFEKRAQYYAAKAYVSQMNRGGQYENLKEVIFLAIANFTMFPEKKSYKSDHVILDRENHQHDLKDFSFTFLELEKFTKAKDQLVSMIEKWAYYFKHAQETTPEDLEMVIGQDSVIKRAYEELDRFYWKEEELFAYEDALKKDMDYEASMDKKFDEGMQKGIEKGETQGERKALVKVAQNMLKQGLSIQNIASATGLSAKEVKKIQEETKKSGF
jgi:predicted transposase/invertase (TIGR01784 family)